MKRYETYKNSGVKWIGEIPEGWETSKLKYEVDMVLGKMLEDIEPKGNDGQYTLEPYLKSRNIGMLEIFNKIEQVEKMWFNKKEKELYELREGDLVMNEGGEVGKVAIWKNTDYTCYIQNSVHKLTPHKDVLNSLYLQYLLCYISNKGYFNSIVSSISISHLTKEKLAGTPILLPHLSEQQQISSYLDYKVGQIDSSVAKIVEQIEDLKSYRQSVISEAVTKGLNPNAKMKDSGVEWIGEIPEGWEVSRIKYNFSFGRGLNITKSDLAEKGECVINYGQIHSKLNTGTSINEALVRYVPQLLTEGHDDCKVSVGDFIFADTSEDKEGCGNCVYVDRDGVYAGYHSLVLKGNGGANKYFAYLFKSEDWRTQVRSKTYGVKVFSITQTIMSDCTILLPPLSEQQQIASYLDSKTSKIDSSIEALELQKSQLEDYKRSLISEAVTGKVDLRGWKTNKMLK